MTRAAGIIFSVLLTVTSLTVFISAGWLWRRSMYHVDVVARLDSAPNNQSTLRGVGSYKGAVLIGSIEDPQPVIGDAGYVHNVFPVAASGSRSVVHIVPITKRGALGFGASKGELRVTIPVLTFLRPPARRFKVVYVPYYSLMLLGMVQPARLLIRRRLRRALFSGRIVV